MTSIFKYYRDRRTYRSSLFVGNPLIRVLWDCIHFYTSYESIRKELFPDVGDILEWEAVDVETKAKPFMLDIARCNVQMGYETEKLDAAAMLEFYIYKRITDDKNSSYEHFVECSEDPEASGRYVSLFKSWEEEVLSTSSSFKIAPLFGQTSYEMMNDYLLGLIEYCKYISRKAGLDPSSTDACISMLDSMLDKKLIEYQKQIERLEQLHKKLEASIDSLEATKKRIEAEWDRPYVPDEPKPDPDFWDATKDYYGKHGEFDFNDEARRVSEDIQQFHRAMPDADLSEHYYWEDILDAKTDGYLDD